MKKLLLLSLFAALSAPPPVFGASSSVSISDGKQTQSFTASLPYHEQLLPAEDQSRQLGGSSMPSYQQYQSYADTGKQYNPMSTDVSYSSAASAQAPSQASITFGGSGASANVVDNKYSANAPTYDTPIVQDSYGNPKPMSGYARPTTNSGNYGPPSSQYGPAKGESYAYQYTHYPAAQGGYQDHYDEPSGGGGLGLFGGKGSLFSGFGGLSSLTGGLGGLGGGLGQGGGFGLDGLEGGAEGAGPLGGIAAVKAVVIAIKAIKGILKFKGFFLLGGLFLFLLLPAILLFLPIPVISITPTDPAPEAAAVATPYTPSFFNWGRSNSQSIGRQILLDLTEKVLGSEECIERMICKLPQVPNKYQKRAKTLWVEYGTKYITNRRVQRGMEAYFDDEQAQDQKEKQAAKQRAFKCNQKFKCSNKFF